MTSAPATWTLSSSQRQDSVARVAANIFIMSHAKGSETTEEAAHAAAVAIEKKAYTTAEVAAVTTTGSRPVSEVTKSYARKLAELLLETVKSGAGGGAAAAGTAAADAGESLDLTGSRDFLTAESATEALAPLLAPRSTISKVKLSTKSFGRDAAGVAATALTNVKGSLTDADISDIIAGRPEEEVLDALRTISAALSTAQLKKLNISDNALGEKGVRACAAVLQAQTTLEGLSVQNVGCSINACKALEELTVSNSSLRQLHLFNNMTDNAGAEHIARIAARSAGMQDFKLASSRVGPRGGIALAQGLTAGANLVRLDLSDNPMTAQVSAALAELIRRQPHLQALNLNDTSLGNKGVTAVAMAVAEGAPLLKELDLALNEVTHVGAKAVALAIAGKEHLHRLNLRENELGDKGAIILSKALAAAPALATLDFCGNQLKRAGATALAQAVGSLAGLKLLALDENNISDTGLDQLRTVMEASGQSHALGPLDENMEEDDEEEDDDDDVEAGDKEDALTAQMAKAGIA